jgi:hypothetical protein
VLYAAQVHINFRARLLQPEYAAGRESLEVGLYEEGEIPWEEMAFESTSFSLRRYFEDRRAGRELLHFHEIARR